MTILSDAKKAIRLVRRTANSRAAHGDAVREVLATPTPERGRFRIAVYFADGEAKAHHVRQWYAPLAGIADEHPVLVVARSATGAAAIARDGVLPVVYARTVTSLETVLEEQDVRIVLYVNQNKRNFQMFRYGRRWHVFIGHGEADTTTVSSNQFKAYDYALVAGDHARDRLARALWGYDVDRRAIPIGRPQADHVAGEPPYAPDERTVVLYAPTWEGGRAAARYGSVVTHGAGIVEALLADPRYRVIYRAHPRSGARDRAYLAAHERIVAAIAASNRADPTARHVLDTDVDTATESGIGWPLVAADVAITDVSATVYDRLATGRPMLVTRPVDPRAAIDEGGYLGGCEWLAVDAVADVIAEIERVRADPAAARLAAWRDHYFGDASPGAAARRFHDAISRLMADWEAWAGRERAGVA